MRKKTVVVGPLALESAIDWAMVVEIDMVVEVLYVDVPRSHNYMVDWWMSSWKSWWILYLKFWWILYLKSWWQL